MSECSSCGHDVDEDGMSLIDCAAGRFDSDGCCDDCGGCFCDGSC